MPAARTSSARVRLTPLSADARSSGPSSSRTCADADRASAALRGPARLLEQRVDRGGIDGALAASASAAFGHGEAAVAVDLVEPFLDHLQRQEVLALLAQDEAQPLDVGRIELAVARRRALGVDEPLTLEEADLRDRDVGELVAQLVQHVADRRVRALGHRQASRRGRRRGRSVSRYRPICTSSPWRSARLVDPLAVDVGAVERADVAQHVPVGVALDDDVAARDRDVVEEDVGVGMAADRGRPSGRAGTTIPRSGRAARRTARRRARARRGSARARPPRSAASTADSVRVVSSFSAAPSGAPHDEQNRASSGF